MDRKIEQGRTVFEVGASTVVEGHVRLIGMIGHDGHIYTLTPATARTLGQALIDEANKADRPPFGAGAFVRRKATNLKNNPILRVAVADRIEGSANRWQFRISDDPNWLNPTWYHCDDFERVGER